MLKPSLDPSYFRTKKEGFAFFFGDGSMGLKRFTPYDKIMVTVGAPIVPTPLIEQLNIGGMLVIPVGNAKTQKMLRLTKVAADKLRKEEFHDFKFVPLLGEDGWKG